MNKQKAAEVLINEGRGDGCRESLTQEKMVTMKGSRRGKKNTWEEENTDYTRLLMDEENETTRRNTNNEISSWIVKVID